LEQLEGWEGLLGLQFENLVLNHVSLLFPKLGTDHSLVLSASPYRQQTTLRTWGCQIDLLIQTRKTLFIVDPPYSKSISCASAASIAAIVPASAAVFTIDSIFAFFSGSSFALSRR